MTHLVIQTLILMNQRVKYFQVVLVKETIPQVRQKNYSISSESSPLDENDIENNYPLDDG